MDIYIQDYPDREDQVTEIANGDEIFCRLWLSDQMRVTVEIFQRVSGQDWILDVDDLIDGLVIARQSLLPEPA